MTFPLDFENLPWPDILGALLVLGNGLIFAWFCGLATPYRLGAGGIYRVREWIPWPWRIFSTAILIFYPASTLYVLYAILVDPRMAGGDLWQLVILSTMPTIMLTLFGAGMNMYPQPKHTVRLRRRVNSPGEMDNILGQICMIMEMRENRLIRRKRWGDDSYLVWWGCKLPDRKSVV